MAQPGLQPAGFSKAECRAVVLHQLVHESQAELCCGWHCEYYVSQLQALRARW